MQKYKLTENNVKWVGRTCYEEDILWLGFSGSGFSFETEGENLSLMLIGDSTARKTENDDECARFAVFVNGKLTADLMMDEPEKEVCVFLNMGKEKKIVEAVKLSEAAMSTIGIQSICCDGKIVPLPQKNILIEFVGDSITCGYGIEAPDETHTFHTCTENVTKAYAYQTAKALNCDYSMVSLSGYGVISGYTGDGVLNEKETLPQYYETTAFSYAESGREKKFYMKDMPWDFEKRTPDIIVVNLGTNDNSYCKDFEDRKEGYVRKYADFLKQIRSHNPKAVFVCILGMMGDELFPDLLKAVEKYKSETGDTQILSFHLDAIRSEDGFAADYHPQPVTHNREAERLIKMLGSLISGKEKVQLFRKPAALTFDDGPSLDCTPAILDLLDKYGAKGSFFLIGKNITEETAPLIKRMADLGFDVENHSFTHRAFSELSIEEVREELSKTGKKIEEITGKEPAFYRAPYLAENEELNRTTNLISIGGYGAEDWLKEHDSDYRAEKILEQKKEGMVILLHDMSGNIQTVEAVEKIIPAMIKDGYQFVTISELFERCHTKPVCGKMYYEALTDGIVTKTK